MASDSVVLQVAGKGDLCQAAAKSLEPECWKGLDYIIENKGSEVQHQTLVTVIMAASSFSRKRQEFKFAFCIKNNTAQKSDIFSKEFNITLTSESKIKCKEH